MQISNIEFYRPGQSVPQHLPQRYMGAPTHMFPYQEQLPPPPFPQKRVPLPRFSQEHLPPPRTIIAQQYLSPYTHPPQTRYGSGPLRQASPATAPHFRRTAAATHANDSETISSRPETQYKKSEIPINGYTRQEYARSLPLNYCGITPVSGTTPVTLPLRDSTRPVAVMSNRITFGGGPVCLPSLEPVRGRQWRVPEGEPPLFNRNADPSVNTSSLTSSGGRRGTLFGSLAVRARDWVDSRLWRRSESLPPKGTQSEESKSGPEVVGQAVGIACSEGGQLRTNVEPVLPHPGLMFDAHYPPPYNQKIMPRPANVQPNRTSIDQQLPSQQYRLPPSSRFRPLPPQFRSMMSPGFPVNRHQNKPPFSLRPGFPGPVARVASTRRCTVGPLQEITVMDLPKLPPPADKLRNNFVASRQVCLFPSVDKTILQLKSSCEQELSQLPQPKMHQARELLSMVCLKNPVAQTTPETCIRRRIVTECTGSMSVLPTVQTPNSCEVKFVTLFTECSTEVSTATATVENMSQRSTRDLFSSKELPKTAVERLRGMIDEVTLMFSRTETWPLTEVEDALEILTEAVQKLSLDIQRRQLRLKHNTPPTFENILTEYSSSSSNSLHDSPPSAFSSTSFAIGCQERIPLEPTLVNQTNYQPQREFPENYAVEGDSRAVAVKLNEEPKMSRLIAQGADIEEADWEEDEEEAKRLPCPLTESVDYAPIVKSEGCDDLCRISEFSGTEVDAVCLMNRDNKDLDSYDYCTVRHATEPCAAVPRTFPTDSSTFYKPSTVVYDDKLSSSYISRNPFSIEPEDYGKDVIDVEEHLNRISQEQFQFEKLLFLSDKGKPVESHNFWDMRTHLEVIETGSSGTVYPGYYDKITVAIKVPIKADQDSFMKYLAEQQLLQRCRHPGVIEYVGAIQVASQEIWLVTRMVDGLDLHTLKYVMGCTFELQEGLSMCQQLATILHYLHTPDPTSGKQIVIHQDIKPENLLVERTGKITLCDFGDSQESSDGILRNVRGATWLYSPIELHTSTVPYSGLSPDVAQMSQKWDIWAAGCIFQELLGGPSPFKYLTTGNSPDEMRACLNAAALSGKMVPEISSDIPASIQQLILACLAPNPSNRPTADKVGSDLKLGNFLYAVG